MAGSLFRTKSIDRLLVDASTSGEGTLKRTLGPVALIALGIGAIIGAGLFVRTAAAIAERSGPSVTIAFIVAGVGCAFAGLCYAEFASMIPIAGSAYTYSYATMGELVAWIIGWDLVLEYAVGAATVAIAWSEYFNKVLEFVGLAHPVPMVSLAAREHERRDRHHQHPRDRHPAHPLGAAHPRHAGVGVRQQHHRGHEGHHRPDGHRDRLGLHQPGESHAVHSRRRRPTRRSQGITHRLRRNHGHPGRRGRRVLRVHRLRRGIDCRAGSEESEEGHADRHPRVAGRLHRALRAVLVRAERRRDGRGFPDGRQGGLGHVRDHEVHGGLRMAREVRDDRHSRGILVRHPRHASRPVARVFLDEPRRPGPEDLLRCAPEIQDAVQVQHAVFRLHIALRGVPARETSSAR